MDDNTMIKIVAIICLTTILVVDFVTMKIDSTLVGSICAIIGGIAGYQFGSIGRKKMEEKIKEEDKRYDTEEEKEAEDLAEMYTKKWMLALENKGKKATPEGLKRYRETAKQLARVRLEMSGSKADK